MNYILETLGKVGFDWRMALFSLVNFLIVYAILKKLFFQKIVSTIDTRQNTIQEGLDNFEKSKTELLMATKKATEIIDESKGVAHGIVEQAHEHAKQQGEHMKQKVREEIEELIDHAKQNIAIQKQEMKEELHRETVALVVASVEKIVGEKITKEIDDHFVKDILKTLK